MADDSAQEERLKLVQDGRVYPVGQVLRSTFDAENHDTLGNDVTGLMIDLSRVPYEPMAAIPRPRAAAFASAAPGAAARTAPPRAAPPRPAQSTPAPAQTAPRPGLLARLAELFGRH